MSVTANSQHKPRETLISTPSSDSAAESLTNQNFGGRVVDPYGLQDGRSVVGYRHRPAFSSTDQNLILQNVNQQTASSIHSLTDF